MRKNDVLVFVGLGLVLLILVWPRNPITTMFTKKTSEQLETERRSKAITVYYRCINDNLERKDYSERSKRHCEDMRREAMSK